MKTEGCEYEARVTRGERDDRLEAHISGCEHCREAGRVSAWMRGLAEQTSPRNLPAPGFLLFKARLSKKHSDTARALLPVAAMQTAAVLLFIAAGAWLVTKSGLPVGTAMTETLRSFSATAPLLFLGAVSGILLCLAAAYFLRDPKK